MNMSDTGTVGPYDSYPNLKDEQKSCCDKMCEDCSAQEIMDMGSYLSDKGRKMKESLAKTVKLSDFEKMKKDPEEESEGE